MIMLLELFLVSKVHVKSAIGLSASKDYYWAMSHSLNY